MLNTPKWIVDLLQEDKFKCPHCKAAFNPSDIRACGVRLSFKNIKKHVLYVEYHCSKCSQRASPRRPPTLLEIWDMTFDEFAFSIIDDDSKESEEGSEKKINKKSNKARNRRSKIKSKIADSEVEDLKNLLHSTPYHEDFLLALGMPESEIHKKIDPEQEQEQEKQSNE